ncbi:AMP-binding protein [Terriglobus albidus]|uniref:AMP-binding protein n=1 Tax=Terriglobus albidus TaxID=1592106 RepID=A0A5B9EBX0_9BACT|nr:AMP-binding protein [Terriglobus albidus]QEE28200.1 AMP-binding protein [Terriglobus albidus]
MAQFGDDLLPLGRAYHWEHVRASEVYLVQPVNGGSIRTWTWQQTMDEARRIAAFLRAQDWEPGARVATLARNSAWWIIAELGTWMAGMVTVPLYPSLRAESIRALLQHADVRACFLGAVDDIEAMQQGVPAGVLRIAMPNAAPEVLRGSDRRWDKILTEYEPILDSPTRGADALATIIYASSTNGDPRGVMHRFSLFPQMGSTIASLANMDSNERFISYLPLAHIAERGAIEATSLHIGCTVYFTAGQKSLLADLKRARPTLFFSVPRLYLHLRQGVLERVPQPWLNRLLRIPIFSSYVKRQILRQLGLEHVRFAASGAAPLSSEVLAWFRSVGLALVEGYGLTETGITHAPRPDNFRMGYVGPALPGVEVRIGPDEEIQMRSAMNMIGYYRNEETTRESFTEDGFFRTGDKGEMAPDGQLKIIGRIKDQFKTSNGKYVSPAPIEKRFAIHTALEATCVMGNGRAHPFALSVLSAEARRQCESGGLNGELRQALERLLADINAELDPHERISFIALVDGPWDIASGLITPTLKLKRNAIEKRYASHVDEWIAMQKPVLWARGL